MKHRTLIFAIISAILIGILIFQFRILPGFSENEFVVSDTSRINSIQIEGNNSINIKKVDGSWIINNEGMAHPTAIANFLYAFQNIEITGMQSNISEENLVSRKLQVGIGNKSMKLRYYFNEKADFLHHEGARKIYRVGIKGNPNARLDPVFSDELIHWQSRIILSKKPDEIMKITVYPGYPWNSDFILKRKEKDIVLQNSNGISPDSADFNREKAIMYFSYFDELYFDDLIENDSILERIRREKEFFRIRITDVEEKVQEIKIFPLYKPDKEKDIFQAAVQKSGSELIYKVNYSMLDLLFEDYESFLKN